MTRQSKHHLAATLAAILGLLSIREGGSVLLGLTVKTYTVLPWLVWYNVVIGFVSVIAAIGLWQKRSWGGKTAESIVTLHALVLMLLVILFLFKEAVAVNSIVAMFVRTSIWVCIILLTRSGSRGQEEKA